MKKNQPSNLELQALSVLWEKGPCTVRQVMDAMPDGKPRAYTTVLSILQVLEKKGLVEHTSQGNTHVYQPCVERQQILRPLLSEMVRNLFGGSSSEAMQFLLQETPVSEEELQEIRALVTEFDRKPKGESES